MNEEQNEKLRRLAEAIKKDLLFWGMFDKGIVHEAQLSWTAISLAGVFRNEVFDLLVKLESIGIISNPDNATWPTYPKDSTGKEREIIEEGIAMEVSENKLRDFLEDKATQDDVPMLKNKVSLTTAKGMGYLKFYAKGPKIEIGNVGTRKFRLLA